MKLHFKNILDDQSGQGLVEYGLIISLIILVVIGGLRLVGIEVKDMYELIENKASEVM